jgi:hypothetical protein
MQTLRTSGNNFVKHILRLLKKYSFIPLSGFALLSFILLWRLDCLNDPHYEYSLAAIRYVREIESFTRCREVLEKSQQKQNGSQKSDGQGSKATQRKETSKTNYDNDCLKNLFKADGDTTKTDPFANGLNTRSAVAHFIRPQSGLNGVYRLLRMVFLGIFTLCLIELLLRLLKWLKVPVFSFKELIEKRAKASVAPERTMPGSERQNLPNPVSTFVNLASMFSLKGLATTLVSGVAGAVVLIPETISQVRIPIATTEHVFDRSDANTVTDLVDRLREYTNRVESVTKETTKIIERTGSQEDIKRLEDGIKAMRDETGKHLVEQTKVIGAVDNSVRTSMDTIKRDAIGTHEKLQSAISISSEIRGATLPQLESKVNEKVGRIIELLNKKFEDDLARTKIELLAANENLGKQVKEVSNGMSSAARRERAMMNYHQAVEDKSWFDFVTKQYKCRQAILDIGAGRDVGAELRRDCNLNTDLSETK